MELNMTNPLVYGVPLFIILIVLEIVYSEHSGKKVYWWKDTLASAAMGFGAVILGPLMKVVFAIVLFTGVYEFFNPEVDGVRQNIMGWQSFGYAWYIWLACQFLDDFAYYWFHRANHEVRIFWAAHIVHHSSDRFNLGTGFRNGWFTILYKPFFYMWIPALGFPVEMLLICMGIEALWQLQLHTKFVPKLGFLENFMNLHTQHQVHHAQNIKYLDKNHGGFLNIFDRMFGTYQPLLEDEEIEYGVIHAPNSYNPFVILTHEYADIWSDVKKAKNLKEAFMYVFGPPGWSPDGSTLTVKQMQRDLARMEEEERARKERAAGHNMATAKVPAGV
ncbi:MAG: sterol desaturase family protein [Cryomorphaceae bacterium]|nr:MAG: sterol desaturase family protein [Cryomorphaceae bacterium]